MAAYNLNGDMIADLSNDAKVYNVLAYNVGNFADGGSHDRYSGDDLEGWITSWIQFFGKYSPDICLLSESSKYIDNAKTELSESRIYDPLYKCVSIYNPSDSYGAALLTNVFQSNVHSGLYTTRVSSESKYVYTTINLNGVDVFVAVTHLNHTISGQEQQCANARAAEMAELITFASAYENVIIGGDLNCAMSEMTPFINAGYTLANGGIFGTFNTYSEDNPVYPLDHILIRGNKLRLKDFQVFKGVTSRDHLATMAKILVG